MGEKWKGLGVRVSVCNWSNGASRAFFMFSAREDDLRNMTVLGIFGVADHESVARLWRSKIVDLIWHIQRFSEPLIARV